MQTQQPIALVTGATSGIGAWTALGLTQRGYQLLLVCRSPERAAATQQWLQQKAPEARVEFLYADLGLQADIHRLAEQLRNRIDRLTLLVNNAGTFNPTLGLTADGVEGTYAVNLIAPMLLTRLCLPLLRAGSGPSGAARIVNVGSASADHARLDLARIAAQRPRSMLSAYAQSKLALLIYSFALARHFQAQPATQRITVNCVHPGVVATRIAAVGGALGFIWRALTPVLLSPERGARCTLTVATSQEWEEVTGRYAKRGRIARANRQADDRALAKKLCNLSTSMIKQWPDTVI